MESLTVANIVIFTIKLCIFLPALQLQSCNCKYIGDNELDHQLLQDLEFPTSRYVREAEELFCPPDPGEGASKMPSEAKTQVVTTPESWIDASIEATNVYRRMHGVPDLIKRDDLCKVSQYYVNILAATKIWDHSNYGCSENLYKVDSSHELNEVPVHSAIDSWYKEINYYDFNTHKIKPEMAKLGAKVGHFTTLVWKDIKYTCIAYAKTEDGKHEYVVAEYWPRGNWAGEYEKNVFPKDRVPDHANPKGTNSEPNPKPVPNAEHKPEPVPNAEPKPKPVPSPEPNPKPAPNSEPKPKPISNPNSKQRSGPKCPDGRWIGTMIFCRDKNKKNCVIAYTPGICINTKGGPWNSGYTEEPSPYKCQVHQSRNCKDVPTGKDIDEKGLDDFGMKIQSFKCPCITA